MQLSQVHISLWPAALFVTCENKLSMHQGSWYVNNQLRVDLKKRKFYLGRLSHPGFLGTVEVLGYRVVILAKITKKEQSFYHVLSLRPCWAFPFYLPRQWKFQEPLLTFVKVLVHIDQLQSQYHWLAGRVDEKYGTLTMTNKERPMSDQHGFIQRSYIFFFIFQFANCSPAYRKSSPKPTPSPPVSSSVLIRSPSLWSQNPLPPPPLPSMCYKTQKKHFKLSLNGMVQTSVSLSMGKLGH